MLKNFSHAEMHWQLLSYGTTVKLIMPYVSGSLSCSRIRHSVLIHWEASVMEHC